MANQILQNEDTKSNLEQHLEQRMIEALKGLPLEDQENKVCLAEYSAKAHEKGIAFFMEQGFNREEAAVKLEEDIKDAWKRVHKPKEPTPEEIAKKERWNKVTEIAENLCSCSSEITSLSMAIDQIYSDTLEAPGLASLLGRHARILQEAHENLYSLARQASK